jgi:hypothetical protein
MAEQKAGDAELVLGQGVVASFQRYQWPAERRFARAPSSLGVLRTGRTREGTVLLPLAPGECFWIGLRDDAAAPCELSVTLGRDGGNVIDVLSGCPIAATGATWTPIPGTAFIDGIRAGAGFEPLARETLSVIPVGRTLHLRVRERAGADDVGGVDVELVDYETFTARTGCAAPEPLDPDAGYRGWLLP